MSAGVEEADGVSLLADLSLKSAGLEVPPISGSENGLFDSLGFADIPIGDSQQSQALVLDGELGPPVPSLSKDRTLQKEELEVLLADALGEESRATLCLEVLEWAAAAGPEAPGREGDGSTTATGSQARPPDDEIAYSQVVDSALDTTASGHPRLEDLMAVTRKLADLGKLKKSMRMLRTVLTDSRQYSASHGDEDEKGQDDEPAAAPDMSIFLSQESLSLLKDLLSVDMDPLDDTLKRLRSSYRLQGDDSMVIPPTKVRRGNEAEADGGGGVGEVGVADEEEYAGGLQRLETILDGTTHFTYETEAPAVSAPAGVDGDASCSGASIGSGTSEGSAMCMSTSQVDVVQGPPQPYVPYGAPPYPVPPQAGVPMPQPVPMPPGAYAAPPPQFPMEMYGMPYGGPMPVQAGGGPYGVFMPPQGLQGPVPPPFAPPIIAPPPGVYYDAHGNPVLTVPPGVVIAPQPGFLPGQQNGKAKGGRPSTRGPYNCTVCGQPKKDHVCKGVQQPEKIATSNKATQVEPPTLDCGVKTLTVKSSRQPTQMHML